MIHVLASALLLLFSLSLLVPLSAQEQVVRYDATQANNYGVVYSLPITELRFDITLRHEQYVPGVFADYAARFLGKEAPKASEYYTIQEIVLNTQGQPDKNATFLAPFRPGRNLGYINCTTDGIIHSINGEGEILRTTPLLAPLPADIVSDLVSPVLPQEYVRATSDLKRAEIAAERLFELQEDLLNIISGKSERMPRDGHAMEIATQTLKEQIASIEGLFFGYRKTVYSRKTLYYTPYNSVDKQILFRFSPVYGFVSADDLSGYPVYMSIQILDQAPLLTEEEAQKKEKRLKGIVYRNPGRALVSIEGEGIPSLREEVALGQLGSLESVLEQIDLKKKEQVRIYFDTHTGALLRVEADKPQE